MCVICLPSLSGDGGVCVCVSYVSPALATVHLCVCVLLSTRGREIVCVCVSPNIVDKETNGSSDFICLSYITQREGREIGGEFIK